VFFMVKALIAFVAFTLASNNAPAKGTQPSSPRVKTAALSLASPVTVSAEEDRDVEQQLLGLANQARQQAGTAPLQEDAGLTQAALAHAQEMANQQQLSHQFAGEPSLTDRLAINTNLHLDRAGENVAYAATVERVQAVLMASLPHRENLLNAGYNVVGIGVLRVGEVLYVTQDFGHGLPAYSAQASAGIVAEGVNRLRGQNGLSSMQRLDAAAAQSAACAMANSESLSAPAPGASYIIRYTTMQPETLPPSAGRAVADRQVRAYSIGSCYARTRGYPNGVYWMVLLFY
jgi:uncharacterized protein YkwD